MGKNKKLRKLRKDIKEEEQKAESPEENMVKRAESQRLMRKRGLYPTDWVEIL